MPVELVASLMILAATSRVVVWYCQTLKRSLTYYHTVPKIPRVKYKTTYGLNDECSICIEAFENESNVTKLSKCGHVFHHECIHKWFVASRSTRCPNCNQ